MEKEFLIQNETYRLVKNYRDAFDLDEVNQKYTDYFQEFDYVFGDYSYEKLRLKGFYQKKNPKCKPWNDITKLDSYIKNYCAYECRYFLLEKQEKEKVEKVREK